jgi:subtilisin family serine protease
MTVRKDLYWSWAKATNFIYLGRPSDEAHLHLLIELADGKSSNELNDWFSMSYGLSKLSAADSPSPYLKQVGTKFCSAWVPLASIDQLPSNLVSGFKLGVAATPDNGRVQIATSQVNNNSHASTITWKRPEVLSDGAWSSDEVAPVCIAIIDDAIAIDHPSFFANNKSRFKLFWDQTSGITQPHSPSHDPFEAAYALTATTPDRMQSHRRQSHGTHVASVAAGNETPSYRMRLSSPNLFSKATATDKASSLDLVGIQLPTGTVIDTSGGALAGNVFDALHFLVRSVPLKKKIVANISFGAASGPHDGSSVFERALDELLANHPRLTVVFPAGNSFESQGFAELIIPANKQSKTLHWRILPDDKTVSMLEIWLPVDNQISVKVIDPSGNVCVDAFMRGNPESEQTWDRLPGGTDVVGGIFRSTEASNGKNSEMILIAMTPTQPLPQNIGAIPARAQKPAFRHSSKHGDWLIELTNHAPNEIQVRAWVQRDNATFGRKSLGRQSYLVDGEALRQYDLSDRAPSRTTSGFGTLNGIATGKSPVVVGGYRQSDKKSARYSSAGIVGGVGPDGSAPSEESLMLKGIPGASNESNGRFRLGGTSVAAPIVTRAIANALAETATITPFRRAKASSRNESEARQGHDNV